MDLVDGNVEKLEFSALCRKVGKQIVDLGAWSTQKKHWVIVVLSQFQLIISNSW